MKPIVKYEPPQRYTERNVVYWEPTTKELIAFSEKKSKPLISKARRFLLDGCIERISDGEWECRPLVGYNKTSYYIKSVSGGFSCNCQGFRKAEKDYSEGNGFKPICSHVLAVIQRGFIDSKNQGVQNGIN